MIKRTMLTASIIAAMGIAAATNGANAAGMTIKISTFVPAKSVGVSPLIVVVPLPPLHAIVLYRIVNGSVKISIVSK